MTLHNALRNRVPAHVGIDIRRNRVGTTFFLRDYLLNERVPLGWIGAKGPVQSYAAMLFAEMQEWRRERA